MKKEMYEHAMRALAVMVVQDRAEKEHRAPEDVYREFRRSDTYGALFDKTTGLWLNGPDYISNEYERELKKKKIFHGTTKCANTRKNR